MPRESMTHKRERALEVCKRMAELYPNAECALHFHDPFSLVIAVLLSAQTTDASVNKVTPILFGRWPDAAALAGAPLGEVEEVLHPLGFFRSKAKHAVETAQMVTVEFGGHVPSTMEELTRLPGVGRKTANIVLNNAFGIVEAAVAAALATKLRREMLLVVFIAFLLMPSACARCHGTMPSVPLVTA